MLTSKDDPRPAPPAQENLDTHTDISQSATPSEQTPRREGLFDPFSTATASPGALTKRFMAIILNCGAPSGPHPYLKPTSKLHARGNVAHRS